MLSYQSLPDCCLPPASYEEVHVFKICCVGIISEDHNNNMVIAEAKLPTGDIIYFFRTEI
jgi:hypothetical protein